MKVYMLIYGLLFFIFFGNTCSSSFAKLILGCFSRSSNFLILPLLKVSFCMSSVYVVVVVAVFNKNHCFKFLFS